MARNEEKLIIGTTSIEESLNAFSNKSSENKELIDRTNRIISLVDVIIERRKALGLTQRDLAALTNIKQPMIARIERLECMPRLDTLIRILDSLKLNLTFSETVSLKESSNNPSFVVK